MQLCACSRRMLPVQDTTFVSNGQPCCSRDCYDRAEKRWGERREIVEKLVARENAARVICVNDHLPSEIYSGDHDDGSLIHIAEKARW